MAHRNVDNIQQESDFAKTPTGWKNRWDAELVASRKASKKFHDRANKVVNRYLDKRGAGEEDWFKLNLFHSNIQTMMSLLYGNLPKVDVRRSFADADDDVARVAGLIIERMLNYDVQRPADNYTTVLRLCLEDRLIPGLGEARIRYEVETATETIEAIETEDPETGEIQTMAEAYEDETVEYEAAIVDYLHWRDVLWSPCRTYNEKRWKAYRSYLTRDELVARFGEKMGSQIPLTKTSMPEADILYSGNESPNEDAWARAEIWEIWSEEYLKVFWFCFEYDQILDIKDDPLHLNGFFPSVYPMVANVTTTAFMPIPDYYMSQDLYGQIDKLETRISLITEAVKVVGVYDASATALKRMFVESVENDMIPVDNWAMFAEKGGINGTVDWFPVQEIADTLAKLVVQRDDNIELLYQITGMNDVMRGGSSSKNTGGPITATESASAVKFGSVRVQALQEEFAEFASALMRLKAQVISKHFSPETIIQQANVQGMNQFDQQLVEPAVQLIKDSEELMWRIEVTSESISMVDYASMKQERVEFIGGMATFIQSATPLVTQDPSTAPFLLEMMKWGMAGFKGSDEIEGVMDAAIEQMQKAQQQGGDKEPSEEDKKAQAEQQKAAADMALEDKKAQNSAALEDKKHGHKLEEIQATLAAEVQETTSISETKIAEIDASAESSIIVEEVKHGLDMKAEEHETEELKEREQNKSTESTAE